MIHGSTLNIRLPKLIRLPKFENDEFNPESTDNNIGFDIFWTAFIFDGLYSDGLFTDKINFVGIMTGKV